MKEEILKIYKRRQKAHDELLACDIELDKKLRELLSYKAELWEKVEGMKKPRFCETGEKVDCHWEINQALSEVLKLLT